MRPYAHEHDDDLAAQRPKTARLDDPLSAQVGLAAATGRTDVLGGSAMLGLQRAAGNGAVGSLVEEERSPVHDVIASGGTPLAPDVRTEMEGRLGHDFSDVRVHNDSAAHESAQAVNAHAYTVGSNVVFQRDTYDPSSTEGKTTLAHELTHVVQQRSGPVDGTPAGGGIQVSDPSDRFEREASATADRAMSMPAVAAPIAAPSGAAQLQRETDDLPALQRDEAPPEEEEKKEDEPPVQGSFVQREEGDEEEPAE